MSILEGKAVVVRQLSKFEAVEGLPLKPNDIIETTPGGFSQIEFGDGSKLGLGADTRVLLQPNMTRRGDSAPVVYVLQGWIKLTPAADKPRGLFAAWTTQHEIAASGGSSVFAISAKSSMGFVETGAVKIAERTGGRDRTPIALNAGEFLSVRTGDKPVIASRPSAEFVAQLPRPFRDVLPSRASRFQDNPAAAKNLGDVSYDDVASWLSAEPAIRLPMVERWKPRLRDKAFRAGLIAHLGAHPEWDPILFPEKAAQKKAEAERAR